MSVSVENIIDIEWLDENGHPIGLCSINGTIFSDIIYGQKVKVKILFDQKIEHADISISVSTHLKKWQIYVQVISENAVISNDFTLPVSAYSDEAELYNYDKKCTVVHHPQDFFVEINGTAFSNPGQILQPYTYFRNYEELTGLFQVDGNGAKTNSYLPDINLMNYEDFFISKNPQIQEITENFIQFVIKEDSDILSVQNKVIAEAQQLWDTAMYQNQHHFPDDRPLYWARNKMQVYLKRNPLFSSDIDYGKSLVKKGTNLEKIITLLEEKSRNYTGIDFSKETSRKKIIITGFDPFLLNEFDNPYLKTAASPNILQSNPSGVVALALAQNEFPNVEIRTMIVPVRYTDFDGSQDNHQGQGSGIIEQYLRDKIAEVDMIITISQSGPGDYNIDKFATATRGGFNDNLNYVRVTGSHSTPTNFEWIPTTLPESFTKAPFVKFNWSYNSIENPSQRTPLPHQKLSQGSGGDYLSNEIFYRVAKLRIENPDKYGRTNQLPTGHFHISKIQTHGDVHHDSLIELLQIVKDGIIAGISELMDGDGEV